MIVNKYNNQAISFIRAVKYYEYLDNNIKLNALDTLIITDGDLSFKEELTPELNNNFNEVYMSNLSFEDSNYIIVLLINNKCTNKCSDKPFSYKSFITPSVYVKDINDIKTLEKIKKELSKINTKKLDKMINLSNNGIYKKKL